MLPKVPSPILENLLSAKGQPAIIENGRVLLWADVASAVQACKGWLGENGFNRGDRIAIIPSGRFAEIIFLWACCDSGVVFCGLNRRFPGDELGTMATHLHAKIIHADIIEASVRFRENSELASLWRLDKPASVIYTSGSAGQPKAILHRLGNHYYNALGSNQNIKLATGDRWQLSLPLYHVSGIGIVFRTLLSGAAMVITDVPISVKQLIQTKTTHLSLVSTQFRRLLSEPNVQELSHQLKAILLGGGPIAQLDIDRGIELGLPIFTSYGLSEMASQVATTPAVPKQIDLRQGTVLPHREVSISKSGEILVKGDTLFAGYIFQNELDSARDASGWFHTRDVGELTGNQLRVTGRLDNQFISGGENIQPELIEQVLMQIPGIQMAVVVPVQDLEFGQRPVAFLATENPLDTAYFNETLSQILPRYMLPIRYEVLPPEMMNRLKPDRLALRTFAGKLSGHRQI